MDIGTGKITETEKEGIPHHMIDIIDPDTDFSVVDFQLQATPLLENLLVRGKTPILCGGTGLYLDSLILERNYLGTVPNAKRRKELEDFRDTHGNEALWEKLFAIDPEYARELHPNNTTYVIRGIEIFEETGKSKRESFQVPTLKYPVKFLTPYEDNESSRKVLYEKINTRVEGMFRDGLVDEVRALLEKFGASAPGLNTIGYREVVAFLENRTSLENTIEIVKQHNRNYAKRQITWNKKYLPFIG